MTTVELVVHPHLRSTTGRPALLPPHRQRARRHVRPGLRPGQPAERGKHRLAHQGLAVRQPDAGRLVARGDRDPLRGDRRDGRGPDAPLGAAGRAATGSAAGTRAAGRASSPPTRTCPTMPRVSFSPDAPVVQVLGLRSAGKPQDRADRSPNPAGDSRCRSECFISDTWSRNPPTDQRGPPLLRGRRRPWPSSPPDGGPEGAPPHDPPASPRPTASGSTTCAISRWRLERPGASGRRKEDKQAIDLQYKVYPYYGSSRRGWASARWPPGTRSPAPSSPSCERARRSHSLRRPDVQGLRGRETIRDTPELADGTYEVPGARCRARQASRRSPSRRPTSARSSRGSTTTLGLSPRVIPPFTPIDVRAQRSPRSCAITRWAARACGSRSRASAAPAQGADAVGRASRRSGAGRRPRAAPVARRQAHSA